jgi:hypothetical protein
MNAWFASLAIAALAMPSLPAEGKSIVTRVCGDTAARTVIPMEAPLPGTGDDHSCCKIGCHAANDRRKKADGTTDDSCC